MDRITDINIINAILIDHRTMKNCIDILRTQDTDTRTKLHRAKEFIEVLKAHTEVEEEVLYKRINSHREFHKKILESFEEHAVATALIEEISPKLKRAQSLTEEHEAKVKVLADLVESHLRSEENEVLPLLKSVYPESVLTEMGLEFVEARNFSEKDLKDYPQLLDEIKVWTNSVLDLSRQFKEKTQRYIQSWR